MIPYFRNGRIFCAAKCDTVDCYRRWTKPLQEEATAQEREPRLENFVDGCLAYTQPKFTKLGASLKEGETNK